MAHSQDSTDPTGVANHAAVTSGAVTRARERKQNAALQMKLAGATWDEIAEVIGYPTARQALVAVECSLERELYTEASQEKMRAMAGKRLDRLLRSVWTKAIDPENPEHLAAVSKARELVAQHTKLFGLDAPTEMVVRTPTQQELDRWVATVVSQNGPAVPEYDIIAGEIEKAYEEEADAHSSERVPSPDTVHDERGDAEPDL